MKSSTPSDAPSGRRQSFNSTVSPQVIFNRLLSFCGLTVLGWAAVSTLGRPPEPVPTPLSALAPISSEAMPETSDAADNSRGWSLASSKISFQLPTRQPIAQANNAANVGGPQISLNGQTVAGNWQQKNGRLGLSMSALANVIGVELLSTTDPNQQPLRWFPSEQDEILSLPAWWDATDRYVDVTDLASSAGWSGQATGGTLQLNLPQRQTSAIRQGRQTWGDRVVVDLNGPTSWRLESTDEFIITIAGSISPEMVRAFSASEGNLITQLHVAPLAGQTVLKIKTKDGSRPQIWTAGNPARVVIDIRRDAMVERDVAWSPGLRWRQQYISVGQHRFPVFMFITRPTPGAVALRPIHANPASATGIQPILTTAQRQGVAGAVNAGFFNRNNQLPLGAVRSGGEWISGPILGRGAMAWNDQGDIVMDRYALQETVTTGGGDSFDLLAVNSGYVQAGIGRYTSGWGETYTPIVDNEIVITVRNGAVSNRQTFGRAGVGQALIPADGYLLALRSYRTAGDSFSPGTTVSLSSQGQPAVFDQYPNVIGGGPLLIRNRQIVLDPQLEGFSTNFIQGAAPRTAVGKTADGTWIIATMHDRVGGRGPTLRETTQIMQQLGAVDALNLDGGSSSSLYLGGQLLNRDPRTAARVNNGIGLFILAR